jgi:hypothetical protein
MWLQCTGSLRVSSEKNILPKRNEEREDNFAETRQAAVHAARTSSMEMQHKHAARTCSKDMQHGLAAWTCSTLDIRPGHAAWTCRMDM